MVDSGDSYKLVTRTFFARRNAPLHEIASLALLSVPDEKEPE